MLCVLMTLCVSLVPEARNPLLVPDLLQRDLPVIIQEMQLDEEQGAILDHVLAGYIDTFEAARQHTVETHEGIDPDSLHSEWRPADWSSHHEEWSRTRAEASAMDNAAEAAAWLQYRQGQARSELVDVLENRPAPHPSVRTRVLEEWRTKRARMHEELRRDVALVIRPDQAGRWNRVEAAIRRQRTPFVGALEGEDIDIGTLVRRQFQDNPAFLMSIAVELAEYEQAWAAAASERDEVLAGLYARRLDAEERKDQLELLSIARQEVAARRRLRDVNLDWYNRIGSVIPPESLNDYQRTFSEAMHPDIFLSSQPSRVTDWLLGLPDTADELRRALVALRVQYGGPRLRSAANERAAQRKSAGRRLTLGAEQRAMAEVFGPTALFRLTGAPEDEAFRDAADLAERRRQLDVLWLAQLRDLLGNDAWDLVPSETRLPPKVLRGDLQDESGEPLHFAPIR